MLDTEAAPNESWINSRWRPAMAWSYFAICLCDFIIFPAVNAGVAAKNGEYHDWHPLTLQGGGLYHLAMGAIIGVAAYSRTQEKLAIFGPPVGSTFTSRTEVSKTTTAVEPKSDEPDGSRVRGDT